MTRISDTVNVNMLHMYSSDSLPKKIGLDRILTSKE